MRKKLFICAMSRLFWQRDPLLFLYRTGISNQTGFYVGESSLLTLFYLLGIFLLVGLYMGCPVGGKSEGASAEGNFLWGASSVLCGILLLMGGLYGDGKRHRRFFAGSSSNSKAFPAGTGLLFYRWRQHCHS